MSPRSFTDATTARDQFQYHKPNTIDTLVKVFNTTLKDVLQVRMLLWVYSASVALWSVALQLN
jgi:hypothetical protein